MIPKTSIDELVTDVHDRLAEMAKAPIPPTPGKRLLEALDPSIRDDVLTAAKALRAKHTARKAVSGSVAKQLKAVEKQMTSDLERLLEVAGRARGDTGD